jgi:hypothetical protein
MRGERVVVTEEPGPLGPIRSRRRAELAARALAGATPEELAGLATGAPVPRVRARLARLAEAQRYEDAARMRDRLQALEAVVSGLASLERLRRAELCLLAPALEPGFRRAYAIAGGAVAASRRLPLHGGAIVEAAALVAEAQAARRAGVTHTPEAADELLLVSSFLRRPPPELDVCELDPARISAACLGYRPQAVVA